MDDQTLYNKVFVNKDSDYIPYEVRFLNRHSNSHISQPPCEVCLSSECRMSCLLPEGKGTLEGVLEMQKRVNERYQSDMMERESPVTGIDRLEVEIVWASSLPKKSYDLSRLNNCQTFKDSQAADPEQEGQIDIYKCFEQFEMTETLGEDNAWYCSNCKKHQKANKKMQIYKAPKTLICHLKRFKYNLSSMGYHAYGNSVGKINQLIHCPQTLDMT